jgi:transcriptional regulator of heat shock response
MKNNNKKTETQNITTAVVITGLFASALLGAHFLFGTEKGKKSLKHVKSWAFKIKGELLEKIEKAKDLNEETYNKIVDELTAKYQKLKGMTVEEVAELSKELKSNWKKIKDEAKKTHLLQGGKSKPVVKKATVKKVSTKKPDSKPESKSESK